MKTYIFEHGNDKKEFDSVEEMAAYVSALDGDSGLAMRYSASNDNGEERELTPTEWEVLQA